MDIVWQFPPQDIVKVNVHAAYREDPLENGNNSGIGVVIRDHEGNIIRMITGTVRGVTMDDNQLLAIFKGLKRALIENLREFIVEIDNLHVIGIINNYMQGVGDNQLGHQIIHILRDPKLEVDLRLVHSNRNRLATYLARNGGETRDGLYVVTEPFGRVQEIQNFDLGLGQLDNQVSEDEDDDDGEFEFGEIDEAAEEALEAMNAGQMF